MASALSDAALAEIVKLSETMMQKEIAAKFGVHQSTICLILSGKLRDKSRYAQRRHVEANHE